MVVVTINDKEMYLDGYLKSNLDDLKLAIERNWDGIGFYCGYEGDGKTTKAAQDCFYMDSTINLDKCVFTPKQFMQAIDNAKEGQAILFDEGHAAFASARFRSTAQIAIISRLTRIRKKRLFIAIVSPTFFDIKKYVTIHRTRYMIRAYAKGLERGFFAFYGREKKHTLYVKGYKTENMAAVTPDFFGSFTKFFPFDWEEYNKKKDAAEQEFIKEDAHKTPQVVIRYAAFIKGMIQWMRKKGLKWREIIEIIQSESPWKYQEKQIKNLGTGKIMEEEEFQLSEKKEEAK